MEEALTPPSATPLESSVETEMTAGPLSINVSSPQSPEPESTFPFPSNNTSTPSLPIADDASSVSSAVSEGVSSAHLRTNSTGSSSLSGWMWNTVRKRTRSVTSQFVTGSPSSLGPGPPPPIVFEESGSSEPTDALSVRSGRSAASSVDPSLSGPSPTQPANRTSMFRMFVGSGSFPSSSRSTPPPPPPDSIKDPTRARGDSVASLKSGNSFAPPFLNSVKLPSLSGVSTTIGEDSILPDASGRGNVSDAVSIMSQTSTIPQLDPNRHPSGSHSPAIRAIFTATRVLIADMPSSILINQGLDTSPLISQLALNLIKNARQEGLNIDVRDRERGGGRGTSRASGSRSAGAPPILRSPSTDTQLSRQSSSYNTMPAPVFSQVSSSEATASLGQALSGVKSRTKGSGRSNASPGGSSMVARASAGAATLGRFAASSLMPTLARKPSDRNLPSEDGSGPGANGTNASSHPSSGPAELQSATQLPRPAGTGTVELESIIPEVSRPPTLLLARMHGSSISSPSFKPRLPHAVGQTTAGASVASRFVRTGEDDRMKEPLTDRYGFIYVGGSSMLERLSF